MSKLSSKAQKVQDALRKMGNEFEILELPDSTRTSTEAAQAAGCEVGQIAKSLILKGGRSNKAYLVVTSGSNRVNEDTIRDIVGEKVKMADADFVKEETGFSIGGVPPLGHINKIKTYIDEDLTNYKEIWAAAGTPHAIFRLTPHELIKITKGDIVSVT